MSASTTKCPKCATSFRVTEAQLQVAKGKVRCGSCLHVFKAADHWTTPPAAAKTADTPKPAAATKPSPDKAAGKFQFDQAAIDGNNADKVLTKPIPAVHAPDEAKTVPSKQQPTHKDDEERFIDDDEDDQEVGVSRAKPTGGIESGDDYSDLFSDLGDVDFDAIDVNSIDDESADVGSRGKKSNEAADESWAKDILTEIEDDSEERAAQLKSVLNAGARDNVFADDGHVKKREGARDGFVSGNRSGEEDFAKPVAPPTPLNRKELLSKIEPAPVEMEWGGSERDFVKVILWSSLSLVAALLLLIQVAWIKFDSWAREPALRPVYAVVCDIAGCDLPDLFNPQAIRVLNLVVRPDPGLPNVLNVDVILQNYASYTQPFPYLELYFTDLNNFPVASRSFRPREYLAGEMAGKTQMPPAKSIHVALQIVNPGAKAVNYRIEISSRKPVNT